MNEAAQKHSQHQQIMVVTCDDGESQPLAPRRQKRVVSPPPPRLTKVDVECDYYRSPSVLSRLILHQKFSLAIRRVQKHSNEAKIWVCSRRQSCLPNNALFPDCIEIISTDDSCSGTDLQQGDEDSFYTSKQQSDEIDDSEAQVTMRQLPIHMACQSLGTVPINSEARACLEDLIGHLAVAYPEGCSRRDHEGRLALHDAVWNEAAPSTIVAVVMASPTVVFEKDKHGRTAIEVNELKRYSVDKDRIADILGKPTSMWELAREEANLRLKHRSIPGDMVSVASGSVLADSVPEDATLWSEVSAGSAGRGQQGGAGAAASANDKDGGDVVAWRQLEERALWMEKKWAKTLEDNFNLSHEIVQLGDENKKLETQIRTLSLLLSPSSSSSVLVDLLEELDELRKGIQVQQSEIEVHKKKNLRLNDVGIGQNGWTDDCDCNCDGIPPLVDVPRCLKQEDVVVQVEDTSNDRPLELENMRLRKQVEELLATNSQYEKRIEQYEEVLACPSSEASSFSTSESVGELTVPFDGSELSAQFDGGGLDCCFDLDDVLLLEASDSARFGRGFSSGMMMAEWSCAQNHHQAVTLPTIYENC